MDRAIVIGGGIGGLLAAHALAGRARQICVVERAHYQHATEGNAPPARRGVRQSHCLHLLMGAGVKAFDRLVPEWRSAAVAQGAAFFDAGADVAMRLPDGWLPRTPCGVTAAGASHQLIEETLRTSLKSVPGVDVVEGATVTDLIRRTDGSVGGATLRRAAGARETVRADLVVDASGTGSCAAGFFCALSETAPATITETVVPSPWQYVSRWVRIAEDDAPDVQCISVAPAADEGGRAGMILRAGREVWGVVLLCPVQQSMPMDDAAFDAFCAPLGDGRFGKILTRAKPLSPVHRYGRTDNRWRRFERASLWPAGLVALGDSVLSLDPYWGLGMTAAARGAVLLREAVDGAAERGLDCHGFQRELAQLNRAPWGIATGTNRDGASLDQSFNRSALLKDAPGNPALARALIEVQHMVRPLEDLCEETAA
ncbi:MAG: FAD-binding protein [Pseudomonadota bacterium]